MKTPRKRIAPPQGPSTYTWGGVIEGENELTVGQPPLPHVELTPAGPPMIVVEAESDPLPPADPMKRLLALIARLDEIDRELLRAVHMRGLTVVEAAALFKVTPKDVEKRLARISKRIERVTGPLTRPADTPSPRDDGQLPAS